MLLRLANAHSNDILHEYLDAFYTLIIEQHPDIVRPFHFLPIRFFYRWVPWDPPPSMNTNCAIRVELGLRVVFSESDSRVFLAMIC